jgi:hypothetical protein
MAGQSAVGNMTEMAEAWASKPACLTDLPKTWRETTLRNLT